MLQWRRPSRGLNKQQFPVWSFFTHGKLQLIVTPLNMQIESFNLIHWKQNHDLHFMWNSHLDKTSFFGRAKGQTAKNLIKKHQVKVATNVLLGCCHCMCSKWTAPTIDYWQPPLLKKRRSWQPPLLKKSWSWQPPLLTKEQVEQHHCCL